MRGDRLEEYWEERSLLGKLWQMRSGLGKKAIGFLRGGAILLRRRYANVGEGSGFMSSDRDRVQVSMRSRFGKRRGDRIVVAGGDQEYDGESDRVRVAGGDQG